jgi:hypothetical protein
MIRLPQRTQAWAFNKFVESLANPKYNVEGSPRRFNITFPVKA